MLSTKTPVVVCSPLIEKGATLLRATHRLLAALSLTASLGACASGTGPITVAEASAPPSASASPTGAPLPSGTATSTADEPATVALGQTIVFATYGPLVYTVTVSNLRTGVTNGIIKSTHGQYIVLDMTLTATSGGFPLASPAIFRLTTADKTKIKAEFFGEPDMPDVNVRWLKAVEAGTSFSGQLMFDAPRDLKGSKISILESERSAGFWTLP